ncbi:chemotaxis protein CheW [Tepidibacillus sp. LV47]
MQGIINLRGNIIPVINLENRFNLVIVNKKIRTLTF